MEPSQDFKTLQDELQKSLVSTVKTVNRITAEDLSFQRTVNPDVAEQLDDKSTRFLDLSSRLLKSAAEACGIKAPSTLEDVEDIDVNWRGVVDVVDTALEKADTALDEYTGLIKRKEPPTDSASDPKKAKQAKVVRNANITKPQVHFELQPNNSPSEPWKPLLTSKPHATVPLEQSLVTFTQPNGSTQFKHPYETEINTKEYPKRVFKKKEPIMYQPMETTEPTWVDTYEGVLEMLEHLKTAKEIAVDLEHHDFRTYIGIVCLMQISTRERDFIVDTIQPWRHNLEVLNEVFADPKIVKVFHGAYMDMIWLQRDLGLYVNSLFDTYFACELLGYPGRGLAYLLSTFADFTADKQYQLADWRMRPLPKEMMYYARSDTHYLLYIYDRVRNDLIASSDRSNPETDLILRALEKSKEVSLYRHEHPEFNKKTGEGTRGWYGYVLKNGHLSLSAEQFAVFRALWMWRDAAARREDENPNFILSANALLQIARVNPPDVKALHSLLPMSPPLAKSCLTEIWDLIREVKAEDGPSLLHFLTSQAPEPSRRNGASRTTKAAVSLPQADGDVDVVVGRLARSQLFGDMPISTRWEESKQHLDTQEDHVPFPWQKFVQQSTEEQPDNGVEPTTDAAAPEAQHASEGAQESGPEESDGEFTLKRGKKRKAQAAPEETRSSDDSASSAEDEDEEMGNNGVLSLVDDDPRRKKRSSINKADKKKQREDQERLRREEGRENRAQMKQLRKEQKEQQREEKRQKESEKKEKTYSAVPFDYSQAASVMHASRNGTAEDGEGKKKKKREKVFDPYVEKTTAEGVKAARKAPPIRGERSATFKK